MTEQSVGNDEEEVPVTSEIQDVPEHEGNEDDMRVLNRSGN